MILQKQHRGTIWPPSQVPIDIYVARTLQNCRLDFVESVVYFWRTDIGTTIYLENPGTRHIPGKAFKFSGLGRSMLFTSFYNGVQIQSDSKMKTNKLDI